NDDHVSRLLSPRARAEGGDAAESAAAAPARRIARRADGIELVLRQRRDLRADTAGAGGGAAPSEGEAPERDRRVSRRDGQSGLPPADRSRAARGWAADGCCAP